MPCATARWSGKLRTSRSARSPQLRRSNNNRKASTLVVRASDGAPESSTMDYQGALKFLGLSDSASSEDMVRAKNQMMSRYREEEDKLKKVSHVAKRRAMTRRDWRLFHARFSRSDRSSTPHAVLNSELRCHASSLFHFPFFRSRRPTTSCSCEAS